jgi:hypothetical protein
MQKPGTNRAFLMHKNVAGLRYIQTIFDAKKALK